MAFTREELGSMLWRSAGSRAEKGQQAGTVALGSYTPWPHQLFLATQQQSDNERRALKDRLFEECKRLRKPVTTIADAREIAMKAMHSPEMTGKHAEMLVLSAMREAGIQDAQLPQNSQIVANAPACYFCANMLTSFGVRWGGLTLGGFDSSRGPRSLTGWWNPLNDRVYANGGPEWSSELPGGGGGRV